MLAQYPISVTWLQEQNRIDETLAQLAKAYVTDNHHEDFETFLAGLGYPDLPPEHQEAFFQNVLYWRTIAPSPPRPQPSQPPLMTRKRGRA